MTIFIFGCSVFSEYTEKIFILKMQGVSTPVPLSQIFHNSKAKWYFCVFFLLKSIGQEKFSKEYAYAIRHSYGKEGKRADYRPYNCMKMASLHNPSGMECHGCPYKVLSADMS